MIGYSFDPRAAADVVQIARDYEQQSPGLGKDFRSELTATIDFLRRLPRAAPVLRGSLRRKSLNRFPYSLIYDVEESEIRIYAVLHHRRGPAAVIKRLPPW